MGNKFSQIKWNSVFTSFYFSDFVYLALFTWSTDWAEPQVLSLSVSRLPLSDGALLLSNQIIKSNWNECSSNKLFRQLFLILIAVIQSQHIPIDCSSHWMCFFVANAVFVAAAAIPTLLQFSYGNFLNHLSFLALRRWRYVYYDDCVVLPDATKQLATRKIYEQRKYLIMDFKLYINIFFFIINFGHKLVFFLFEINKSIVNMKNVNHLVCDKTIFFSSSFNAVQVDVCAKIQLHCIHNGSSTLKIEKKNHLCLSACCGKLNAIVSSVDCCNKLWMGMGIVNSSFRV